MDQACVPSWYRFLPIPISNAPWLPNSRMFIFPLDRVQKHVAKGRAQAQDFDSPVMHDTEGCTLYMLRNLVHSLFGQFLCRRVGLAKGNGNSSARLDPT